MRTDPELSGPEIELLPQFLDYYRATLAIKAQGLTAAQLAQRLAPSELTIGGIIFHMAIVEEVWTEVRFLGLPMREPFAGVDFDTDPDWEFHAAGDYSLEQLLERYEQACERSRYVVAQASSLDQLSVNPMRDGRHFSMRWMLLHLLEETARHAGHIDLLRESIDGTTGD